MSVTGPSRPSIVVTAVGSAAEQVAQAAQLVGVVPVHPHPEPDRLLGLARGVGQDALLAERHELGDPERLDVALGREPEVALDVDLDPQALAVEPVLVALVLAEHRVEALVEVLVGAAPGVVDAHRVVGRDRAVEEAPAAARRRSARAAWRMSALAPDVRGSRAPGRQDRACEVTGRNIGLVGLGAVGGRGHGRSVRRWRWSAGPSILPAMHEPGRRRDRARARHSWRRSSPCSSPGSVSLRRRPARALGVRRAADPGAALVAGIVLRVDRIAPLGFLIDPTVLDAVFVVNLVASSSTGSWRSSTPTGSPSPERRGGHAAVAGPAGRAIGRSPLSLAGLVAVVLVMAGSHVVVARYDMLAAGRPRQRLHLHQRPDQSATSTRRPRPRTPRRRPERRAAGTPSRPTRRTPRARRSVRGARRRRSRRGTARSASTSCSSARTSVRTRAPSTRTR